MIEPSHRLSVTRPCGLLALPRSTYDHRPKVIPPETLALMRRLDELHLVHPWMGSRSLRDQLQRDGVVISRDRVRRLMRVMGIHALYRKPRTTILKQGHTIYPYLLGGLVIERLWRSVKYEEIYLHAYETVADVKARLNRYFSF